MRLSESLAMVASLQFGLAGALDCHSYALRGPGGVVLIDSGAGTHTQQILKNVAKDMSEVPVAALIVTHAHVDHCGGAAGIRKQTGCVVIAPEPSKNIIESGDEEASGLRRAREQGLYPSETSLACCKVDKAVRDGEMFSAAGLEFKAFHVRGHSPDAFCYFTRALGSPSLFSGDVVFYGGVLGVINANGSGMEGYRADLHKLSGLGIEGLFPGHGLFTLRGGQRHIDSALEQMEKGFLGRQIGQEPL